MHKIRLFGRRKIAFRIFRASNQIVQAKGKGKGLFRDAKSGVYEWEKSAEIGTLGGK